MLVGALGSSAVGWALFAMLSLFDMGNSTRDDSKPRIEGECLGGIGSIVFKSD